MNKQWEYCTMVVTQSMDDRMLVVSILRANGGPESRSLGVNRLGPAIARLGVEGWEMCGFYTVPFVDGLGQQFYFKRPVEEAAAS